ncbi:MAG TPA: TIGR04283 family arsenosugar biosynthesis glycosyltransferase [Abditibacteriaceae bacterium]|jgi:rSAM/selenodomain-associated transferase 2
MKLSVVIPALNEERALATLLPLLNGMLGVDEIVLCDGGSDDATVRVAEKCGAIVVQAKRNRGAQLNAGAQAATGDVLWFLHADTRPHPYSAQRIKRALKNNRVLGGNFRLRFDDRRVVARLFEAIARGQRRCGVYYGDSGIWVRRDVYEKLAGYPVWPLFEDYDFVRRLERFAGRNKNRTVCLPLPLVASARRFQRGASRVLLTWAGFQILFSLGVSPHWLARIYHR